MFNIVCVTNRKLCKGDFTDRIAELYKNGVTVILREKDLTEAEYELLAKDVIRVCPDVILHTYINIAEKLGIKKIHLPIHLAEKNVKSNFRMLGVSVHSPDEAVIAEKKGADYVTAGHVFATDCKKGLEPRGIEFLKSTVDLVDIPVYAIGGISPDNIGLVRENGAKGACIMSGLMQCGNIEKYLTQISKNILKKQQF